MLMPYSHEHLEQQLDIILDAELNRIDVTQTLEGLSQLPRTQQDKAFYWIDLAAKAHIEIGYSVSLNITQALGLMNEEQLRQWIVHAMELLDTDGLIKAIQALSNVKQFALEADERTRGVTFDKVSTMLTFFVQGLSGRALNLSADNQAWTDTDTLYLPHFVGRFDDADNNFKLYKSILAHQWSQLWYGTWRLTLDDQQVPHLIVDNPEYSDKSIACLHRLECIRLDARIKHDLPGIHRDMNDVLNQLNQLLIPEEWQAYIQPLLSPQAQVNDSCALLDTIIQLPQPKEPLCFQGKMAINKAIKVIQNRLAEEKKQLQKAIWKQADDKKDKKRRNSDLEFKIKLTDLLDEEEQMITGDIDITIDDEPVHITVDAEKLMSSIIQDFGQIPEEYLQKGFAGAYDPNEKKEDDDDNDPWSGTYHEEGAFVYNEWDYKRQHYRKDWCVLRELTVKEGSLGFVHATKVKYHHLIKQIHNSFEALRGEDKLLKQQVNGDDIDIDAFVSAWSDVRMGMEMSERLYSQMHRVERSIAVMFMVDMSGSTNGWINDAERESLILLCEALEKLGDRYAIYGFSGWARKRCEIFNIKTFEEPYSQTVQAKIAGIEAQNYTRMGVAIRHLSQLLNQVDAKTRILITLSDGRPEDYGEYRGQYGIEDTRMALVEARRSGIHPFCITIDKQGLDYLPHMYGQASYVVLDDVAKLPLKIADIYRKLTR